MMIKIIFPKYGLLLTDTPYLYIGRHFGFGHGVQDSAEAAGNLNRISEVRLLRQKYEKVRVKVLHFCEFLIYGSQKGMNCRFFLGNLRYIAFTTEVGRLDRADLGHVQNGMRDRKSTRLNSSHRL